MNCLLFTTLPQEDETFTSFLLRTCQVNEYDSLYWIAKLVGIDNRQLAKPNPEKVNFNTLAQIVRIDESILWELTFYKDIQYFESKGDYSSFKDHVNSEYDKICPACFEENQYIKKVWNLKINMGCPIHSLLLINTCPKCNKKISSIRREISKCNCGFKLINLPKVLLKESEILHSRIIVNAYYAKKLYEICDDSPINDLRYYSLTKLIHSFWYRINNGRKGIGINQINPEKQNDFEQLISVYHIFLNWPYNFVDFLNKSTNKTLLTNIKRDFYTKLYEEGFLIFVEEFRSFLERKSKQPVIFKNFNTPTNLISRTKAIKLLNMSSQAITMLIENGILVEYKQINKNNEYKSRSITVESLNNFLELKKYIVFKKELADYLGLTTKNINLFEDSGWIKRIELFSKKNDKKSYYDIRFGEELISKIEKNVLKISEERSREQTFISFRNFHNRAAVQGIAFIELVKGLINGSVNIYKVEGEKPFKSYYFKLEEATIYIKIFRYSKFSEKGINLNIQEVCELLRVSYEQLSSWKKKGFLRETEKNKYGYNELQKFVSDYVPLGEVLKKDNNSGNSIVDLLEKEGIYPVYGDIMNGFIYYLYRTTDLDKVGLGSLGINLNERTLEIIKREKSYKIEFIY